MIDKKINDILEEIAENRRWLDKIEAIIPVMRKSSFMFIKKDYLAHLDLYDKFLREPDNKELWLNSYDERSKYCKKDFIRKLQNILPIISIGRASEILFIFKSYHYRFTYIQEFIGDKVSFFENQVGFEIILDDVDIEFNISRIESFSELYDLLDIMADHDIF